MITTDKSYPSTLPYPIRDGYEARTVQTFVRTEMGSGRARQRRLFSHVPTMVSVTWIFNQDGNAAAFEAWFRDVINDGADWFNCPLKTPLGAKEYVCRFTEMYTGPDLVGLCAWRSTAMLEIYERQILQDGWGNLPDWSARWSEFDVLMNWVWPEEIE